MYFLNVTSLEPLPGFKASINISSQCFVKNIQIECMSVDQKFGVLRYIRYLADWVKMGTITYDEKNMHANFLGTTEQISDFIIDFIIDFMSDFNMNTIYAFYLFGRKWHSLSIAENNFEFHNVHIFMILNST